MNLKLLRSKTKLTQDEMAKELNITRPTYANYESEITQPPIELLCKIADYHNVSLDYLVGRNYNNEIGYLTEEQKNLVNLIKELNQLNLLKAIGYISGLVAGQ